MTYCTITPHRSRHLHVFRSIVALISLNLFCFSFFLIDNRRQPLIVLSYVRVSTYFPNVFSDVNLTSLLQNYRNDEITLIVHVSPSLSLSRRGVMINATAKHRRTIDRSYIIYIQYSERRDRLSLVAPGGSSAMTTARPFLTTFRFDQRPSPATSPSSSCLRKAGNRKTGRAYSDRLSITRHVAV